MSSAHINAPIFPREFVALIAVTVALAAAAFSWWQLSRYEDNLLEIFAKTARSVQSNPLSTRSTWRRTAPTTTSSTRYWAPSRVRAQYWTLSKKNRLIFVKDVTDSTRYRGFSTKTYYDTDSASSFISGLSKDRVDHAVIQIDGNDYIASGTAFSYGGSTYRLCLLTGKHVVIDQNAYLAARVNLAVTIAVVLILFVATCVGMSLRNDSIARRLRTSEADNRELRLTIERLNDEVMGRKPFDTQRSLFDIRTAQTLLDKLSAADKLPATFVSLRFDAREGLNAFLKDAVAVLDRSVVRFADDATLVLVFIGAEAEAASYALSLVEGSPEPYAVHTQRAEEKLRMGRARRKARSRWQRQPALDQRGVTRL